jgi:hypothetical protein
VISSGKTRFSSGKAKAFDRIDFNILMQKLINMRVHPILINWIATWDRLHKSMVG